MNPEYDRLWLCLLLILVVLSDIALFVALFVYAR